MKTALATLALCAGIAFVPIASSHSAYAGDGRVAAGVLGGFLAGTVLGSALAPRPLYPPPAYAAPAPVYAAPPPPPGYEAPTCYWAEGEPIWNGRAWVSSRVRACD